MRSSDSANSTMISTCDPKVSRSGSRKKAATASSHGKASTARNRWRVTRLGSRRAGADAAADNGMVPLVSTIKPRRLDQQNRHGDGIEEEAAGLGVEVLAGGVENSKKQRRGEGPLDAAETADGDDEQEQHEVDEREGGC